MLNQQTKRQDEKGNVLFLILIAVALFAALSYAVTQSTRSGSGSTEKETNLLNSATLTQYPTALRTAVVRMILNGKDIDDLGFNPPSAFGALSDPTNAVFHPSGGGAVYQESPNDAMASNTASAWYYNGNFEVPEVGASGAGGNELMAILPGVSQGICRKVNEELGVTAGTSTGGTGIPDFNGTDANYTVNHLEADAFPITDQQDIDNATDDFNGQPSACFYDSSLPAGGRYVFYAVILER